MPPTDSAPLVPSSPAPGRGLQRQIQGLRQSLDAAQSPEEAKRVVALAKGLRRTAAALRGYERQADEIQVVILWGTWKKGLLIERLFREIGGPSPGGRPPKNGPQPQGRFTTALRDLGIGEDEAQRARVIAKLEEKRVQQLIDEGVRTESGLYLAARGDKKRARTTPPGTPFAAALAGLQDEFDSMADGVGGGVGWAVSIFRRAVGFNYIDALDAEWVRSHGAAFAPMLRAADLVRTLQWFADRERRPS